MRPWKILQGRTQMRVARETYKPRRETRQCYTQHQQRYQLKELNSWFLVTACESV